MKVLHIIDDLSMGGAQNLLIPLTDYQQKAGNDVTVLQLVNCNDETVAKKIANNGVQVISLKEEGFVYNPLLIFKIYKHIKRYDIIHVHLFPALYWAGGANLLLGKKQKLIYTEHSTTNKRRRNPFLRLTDRFVYGECYQQIVACGDKALETYKLTYPSIKHVCAINNGVNTRKYEEALPYTKQELLNIPEDSFVVTMVARFASMKRQDTVVEAISKLPSKFHACFVGSEPNDVGLLKVKNLAESLSVKERVHFLYLRSDVDRILKTSDSIIMSSEYEGLSLSSIEGMAAGKPFIATNVSGLREIVEGAGILFELGDSNELKDILLKLESDSNYYSQVVGKCQRRAAEYDISKMANQYERLYAQIAK